MLASLVLAAWLLPALQGVHPVKAWETLGTDPHGGLGRQVSFLGDVDGDRVPDIYASDWSNTALGAGTGRIYVHSGKTGSRLLTLTGGTAGEERTLATLGGRAGR